MQPGSLFLLFAGMLAGALRGCAAQSQSERLLEAWLLGPDSETLEDNVLVLRNAEGTALVPESTGPGIMRFRVVGNQVTVQVTCRSKKSAALDLELGREERIRLVLRVDPDTATILAATQAALPEDAQTTGPSGQRRNLLVPPIQQPKGAKTSPISGGTPINDSCFNSLEIFDGLTPFDLADATTDGAAHPGICQFDGETPNDIWFHYRASCDGTLAVRTCRGTEGFDTDLVLYPGDPDGDGDIDALDCARILGGNVLPLGCNDNAEACGSESALEFTTLANELYLIRLGGTYLGQGFLGMSCASPPTNDECVDALDVLCNTTIEVDNTGATTNPDDPKFPCAQFLPPVHEAGSIWFRFVAEHTNVFIAATGIVALYEGTCSALTQLDCNDLFGPLQGICYQDLVPGNVYYVQVARDAGLRGLISVEISCPGICVPPLGDSCSDAPLLACNRGSTFDNFGAHVDPSDPPFSCRLAAPAQGVGSVWRRFVATAPSAKLSLNPSTLALDTLLAAYSGTCGNLTELACSDDEGFAHLSELALDGLTLGETYYVQVASLDRFEVGELALTLGCPNPAPPNDVCEHATTLAPLPATTEVNVFRAISDAAFCGTFFANQRNVWYRVIGTGNTLTATTCDERTGLQNSQINVFCGDCAALVCVAGARSGSCSLGIFPKATLSWCSQAGASYLVTVGTTRDLPGGGGDIVHLEVSDTGVPCETLATCLPEGACCLADGTCLQTTGAGCAARAGLYRGDGTSCTLNAVVDGDFEAGPLAGHWSESSTNFESIVCEVARCGFGGGSGPRSGRFWAWFGGAFALEEGSLEQELVIPPESTLHFQLEIPISSGNGADFLRVRIDGTTLFEVFEGDPVWSGAGYRPVVLPLQAFADGGSHRLRFEGFISGEDVAGHPALSNFFVDDVSIRSPSDACAFVLDFESEDDLATALANGQSVSTPPEFGRRVRISSAGPNAGAAIFDSDPGGPNDPSINADMLIGQGNVLLLQDSRRQRQTIPGIFDEVTDDPEGGDMIFDFPIAVEPRSVLLADINPPPNRGASVTLVDRAGRTRVYSVQPGWTGTYGDAGPWRLDLTTLLPQAGNGTPRFATAEELPGFLQNDVVRIVVHMTGFGALDELTFVR